MRFFFSIQENPFQRTGIVFYINNDFISNVNVSLIFNLQLSCMEKRQVKKHKNNLRGKKKLTLLTPAAIPLNQFHLSNCLFVAPSVA